jgi:TP901 family phage tail tape measure protein
MTKVFALFGEITLAGASSIKKELSGLDGKLKTMSRTLSQTGKNFEKSGLAMTKSLTLPIVALGAATVKFGSDFEKSMKTSTAIMGNLSDEMKRNMADTAKEISTHSTSSAKDLADTYYYLASAGLDAEKSVSALDKVTKFAEAGQFELQQATSLLIDAQSALGLKVDETAQNEENLVRVSDVLVKANILANAGVQEFSESLTNKAAAAIRIVGKDIEEGVAVLAAYADQGTKGAEAGTQLGIVMRDLQKATIKSGDEFKKHNVAVYDESGEMRNMADIIGDLENALAGMSDEQKKVTLSTMDFQEKSVASLLTLIGTSDKIREYEKALRSAGGTTEEVAAKQLDNFQDQMKMVWHQIQNVFISLSNDLLPLLKNKFVPYVEKVVKTVKELVDMFRGLSDGSKILVFAILGITAAIGPMLFIYGKTLVSIAKLITAFRILNVTMAANPALLVGTAIAGLTLILGGLYLQHRRNVRIQNDYNDAMQNGKEITKELRDEYEKLLKKQKDNADNIEYMAALMEAYKKERRFHPLLSLREFEKEFSEQWKSYNDAATNSYDQIGQTRQKYDEKEKVAADKRREAAKAAATEDEELTEKQLKHRRKLQEDMYDTSKDWAEKEAEATWNIRQKEIDADVQYYDDKIAEERRLADEEKQLDIEIAAAKKALDEDEKERNRTKRELEISMAGQVFDIVNGINDIRMQNVENRYVKEREAIENSLLSEEDKKEKLSALDEKEAKEKRKIARQAAIAGKVQALFNIAMFTAEALVKAMTLLPPFNMIYAGIIKGLSIAQAAVVMAAPLPMKKGGLLPGSKYGTTIQAGEDNQAEIILPLKTGVQQLASALIGKFSNASSAIQQNSLPAAAMAGTVGSSAVHLHVGTLIADRGGLKQLNRTLEEFRLLEESRIGA